MFPKSTTKLNNYHLATNPVNIYIDGRHLFLSAFPYMSTLRKHIIHNSTEESEELCTGVTKLVATNAHLNAGLNKNFENCLSLFHLPDFLVFGDYKADDSIDGNAFDYINRVNLPSFSKQNFKFKVFYTNPKLIENSQILV